MDNEHILRDYSFGASRSRSPSPSYERKNNSHTRSRSRSPGLDLHQNERFRGARNERSKRRRHRSSVHLNRHHTEYPSDALLIEGWQDSADTEDVARKFEAALSKFSAPRGVRVLSRKRAVATFSAVEQAQYVLEKTGGSLKLDDVFTLRFYSDSPRQRAMPWNPFPSSSSYMAAVDATPAASSASFPMPFAPHYHMPNIDYAAVERARERQRALRNASSREKWPPAFEEAGGEYDLNTATGWYCHEETSFMYDPDADLYLDPIKKKWYRRKCGHSSAASPSDAFEEVETSTLPAIVLSKLAILGDPDPSISSHAPAVARTKAEASSAIVFTRAVSPNEEDDSYSFSSQNRPGVLSSANVGGIDVDALIGVAKASSSKKRKRSHTRHSSEAIGSATLPPPSSASFPLSSSSSSNAVFKTTDTQVRRNSALIQQWTKRQQDGATEDMSASREKGGGGGGGGDVLGEQDMQRMACTYPIAPCLRYKAKPVTVLSKKDHTTWLCWLCIRKFNDETALAKHVTLSDLHRTNAKAAASRTVVARLAEEDDSPGTTGAGATGAGSITPLQAPPPPAAAVAPPPPSPDSSNAAAEKAGDIFTVVASDPTMVQSGTGTTIASSSSGSKSNVSVVDRAEARRTMYGQKKRLAGGGDDGQAAYGSHYRAHSRGGRRDVTSFPSSKKNCHSHRGRDGAPVVVRASTKIPMDTRASFGAKLMRMMGWKPGEALGNSGNGIVDPVDAIDGMGGRLSRRGVERLGLGHPNADARTDTSTLSGMLAAQRKKRRRERR